MGSELYTSPIGNLTYKSFDINVENQRLTIGLNIEIFALLQEKKFEQIAEYLEIMMNYIWIMEVMFHLVQMVL